MASKVLPQDETVSFHKNWWIRISEYTPQQRVWAWDEICRIAFDDEYKAPQESGRDKPGTAEQKIRWAIFRDYAPMIRSEIEHKQKEKIIEVKKLLSIVNETKRKKRRPGRPRKSDYAQDGVDMFCESSCDESSFDSTESPCTDLLEAHLQVPSLIDSGTREDVDSGEDFEETMAKKFMDLEKEGSEEEETSKYSRDELDSMLSNLRFIQDDEEKRKRLNEMFKSGKDLSRLFLDRNGKIPIGGLFAIAKVGKALLDEETMKHVYERFVASSWENPQHRVASSKGELSKSITAIVFNYEKQKQDEERKRREEEKKKAEEEYKRGLNMSAEDIAELQNQRRAALEND